MTEAASGRRSASAVLPFPAPLSAPLSAPPAAGLPERRFTEVEGIPIAWVEAGAGPDLILVHGALMCLEDMWLGPMAALARHFRVVAIDRPGHGASGHARLADGSLWRQAGILRGLAGRIGLERPVVAGHSFGGAVALAYGLAYPDATRGIVAMAPIAFPEPRLEQVLFGPRAVPVGGDLLSALLGPADALLLPLLWRAMFLPQGMPERFAAAFPFGLASRPDRLVAEGENANLLWPDLARSVAAYPTCRVPVHILGGDRDIVTNQSLHGRGAALMIPGARLHWLPGQGHMLHHFRPDAVVEAALAVAG
ncbi:alpha/beta fold hydrolase [Methylobacterium symbioticum]|uniref:4,5:9,10-diseco-3-hydroxy-5,9, 17-trioxoandrosta-1(10),2-diene-4-oate hydrolase n=1 Tax=Methylobacterium symbioticum TaxID=2584084 RepID=A0A509EHX5_9HYPH|nr:alpha/beta hydrolase [uncultured Methylobacterium sp.]VUD73760.1 4,5:9,10-diseco-3-hydroxy-5,9, 17-trioxoandrosta-1(10),2-diene-4-oate hydrolase [Methylobacterium symbioticum]